MASARWPTVGAIAASRPSRAGLDRAVQAPARAVSIAERRGDCSAASQVVDACARSSPSAKSEHAQVEAEVERRARGCRESPAGAPSATSACSKQSTRLAVGRARGRLGARLPEVADRLVPRARPRARGGRAARRARPGGRDRALDRLDDPGVQRAPPLLEQAAVGHLVGQRVLEGVLEVGEQARLVEELGGLQVGEAAAQLVLGQRRRSAWSSANGTSLPMTAAAWSRRLSSGGSRSMRAARIACTVAGTWMRRRRRGQAVGPALARPAPASRPASARSPRGRTGCPRSARSAARLSGASVGSSPEQRVEQRLGALGRQRVEPELGVVGLAAPARAGTRAGS